MDPTPPGSIEDEKRAAGLLCAVWDLHTIFAAQPLDLQLFRLHLTEAGKGLARIGRELLHPFAENVLMNVQIPRRLGD